MFTDQGPDNDKECLHKTFPLNDAVIKRVQAPREVTSPLYSDSILLPSFRPLINKYKFSYYDDVNQCYITGNNSQSYSGY